MRYLKPHFYDKFVCTAGACPDTCCAGWQIMIDEESLDRYGKEKGEFGTRLRNSIDWEEECFYQNDRRCAFLNEKNLCDLYKALGPDALCDTCRMYPRHTEEYEGLRELSLSLSCPEAAKMILSCQEPVHFVEEEDEKEDDFEDFDEAIRLGKEKGYQGCPVFYFTGPVPSSGAAHGGNRTTGRTISDLCGRAAGV